MKNCASCEKPLETPLDEYGPAKAPVCRTCFFECKPAEEIDELEDELAELEEELESIEAEIDSLEGQKWQLERDIRKKREEMEASKNPPVKRKPKSGITRLDDLPIFAVAITSS